MSTRNPSFDCAAVIAAVLLSLCALTACDKKIPPVPKAADAGLHSSAALGTATATATHEL